MKKTYKVEGELPVFGTEPGDTFEAEMPEEQEARLIARGSISTDDPYKVGEPVAPQAEVVPPPPGADTNSEAADEFKPPSKQTTQTTQTTGSKSGERN